MPPEDNWHIHLLAMIPMPFLPGWYLWPVGFINLSGLVQSFQNYLVDSELPESTFPHLHREIPTFFLSRVHTEERKLKAHVCQLHPLHFFLPDNRSLRLEAVIGSHCKSMIPRGQVTVLQSMRQTVLKVNESRRMENGSGFTFRGLLLLFPMACGILVPRVEIALALEGRFLATGPPGKSWGKKDGFIWKEVICWSSFKKTWIYIFTHLY